MTTDAVWTALRAAGIEHVRLGPGPGLVAERFLTLIRDDENSWTDGDGRDLPELAGCVDRDISGSPLTNTLPIRRLGMAEGATAELSVVFVDLPELTPRAVQQVYTCLSRDADGAVHR